MNENPIDLLKSILEKTYHINAGIKVEDEDIILNSLEEREIMLSEFNKLHKEDLLEELKPLLTEIQIMDEENQKLLGQLIKKVEQMTLDNKKQMTQLDKGRKIVSQYEQPYSHTGGGYFDHRK